MCVYHIVIGIYLMFTFMINAICCGLHNIWLSITILYYRPNVALLSEPICNLGILFCYL